MNKIQSSFFLCVVAFNVSGLLRPGMWIIGHGASGFLETRTKTLHFHVYVCVYQCVCVCVCVSVCCVHTGMCVVALCTHTHTHIHMYTHTHALSRSIPFFTFLNSLQALSLVRPLSRSLCLIRARALSPPTPTLASHMVSLYFCLLPLPALAYAASDNEMTDPTTKRPTT